MLNVDGSYSCSKNFLLPLPAALDALPTSRKMLVLVLILGMICGVNTMTV